MRTFYLGTHMPHWLATSDVPLFISNRRLHDRKTLPRARTRWALDSGAFTEIALLGDYETTPLQYVNAVRRYRDEIGSLDWAAPQDHMTEPWVLAKSEIASTVREAQQWTIQNYDLLRSIDDTLPFIPVLQGQTIGDYLDHVDMYANVGYDLAAEPVVGLGSVCRRHATLEIAELIATLSHSFRLHGFGVKSDGIVQYGWMLESADSMSWSYRGRRIRPCPVKGLTSCANCLHHALDWRRNVMRAGEERRTVQLPLI